MIVCGVMFVLFLFYCFVLSLMLVFSILVYQNNNFFTFVSFPKIVLTYFPTPNLICFKILTDSFINPKHWKYQVVPEMKQ